MVSPARIPENATKYRSHAARVGTLLMPPPCRPIRDDVGPVVLLIKIDVRGWRFRHTVDVPPHAVARSGASTSWCRWPCNFRGSSPTCCAACLVISVVIAASAGQAVSSGTSIWSDRRRTWVCDRFFSSWPLVSPTLPPRHAASGHGMVARAPPDRSPPTMSPRAACGLDRLWNGDLAVPANVASSMSVDRGRR